MDQDCVEVLKEVAERHFGEWVSDEKSPSIIELYRKRLGFRAAKPLRVFIISDDFEPISRTADVDIVVVEDWSRQADLARRFPYARAMNVTTFIDFLVESVQWNAEAFEHIHAANYLHNLPRVNSGGMSCSALDWCLNELLVAASAMQPRTTMRGVSANVDRPNKRQFLILGGPHTGKTTLLKSLSFYAFDRFEFKSAIVDASASQDHHRPEWLVDNRLSEILGISNGSREKLLQYFGQRILFLLDDFHSNSRYLRKVAECAETQGAIVIAAADPHLLDIQLVSDWNAAQIEPITAPILSHIVRTNRVTNSSALYGRPSLDLANAVCTVETASWFRSALLEGDGIEDFRPTSEAQVATRLWESWKNSQKNDSTHQRRLVVELCALHAIETKVSHRSCLDLEEIQFLAPDSVCRLTNEPTQYFPPEALNRITACPFLHLTSDRSIGWRSRLMRSAAVADWLTLALSSEQKRHPLADQLPLPESAVALLVGSGFLHPLLGLARLDIAMVDAIVGRITSLTQTKRSGAEALLRQVVENTRESSFFSVRPWRYLGGNCLTLLSQLSGGKPQLNLAGCRIAGARLRNADLSQTNLIGAYLPEADLTNVALDESQLAWTYLRNASIDDCLRDRLASFESQPVFGLPARDSVSKKTDRTTESIDWSKLAPPQGFTMAPSSVPTLGLDPFAYSEPITNSQYHQFTAEHSEFSPKRFEDVMSKARKDIDEYHLNHWQSEKPDPSTLEEPVVYVSRYAAIAYILESFRSARLPTVAEWEALATVAPFSSDICMAEWLWGNESLPATCAKTPGSVHVDLPFPPLMAPPTEAWLGLVAEDNEGTFKFNRINTYNANEDVTFRLVVDFPALVQDKIT